MQTNSNQSKVRMLYQMLFEMATGNLAFRIENQQDDEIDELATILSGVAERMRPAILESGFINPVFRYQNLSQGTFILDSRFRIKSFSSTVSRILEYQPEDLFNKNFGDLLSKQSLALWNDLEPQRLSEKDYHSTLQLIYRTSKNLLIPSFCTVSKLFYSDKIIISFVTTILQDFLSDLPNISPATPSKSEAFIMQEVYEYILEHLETQLPGSRDISRHFGINEFRLKSGFRHFFKTSIHQFYTEERLKKAHLMIQQSDLSIKSIAYHCGFNTYLNFYKAFKKRFRYAPSDLARQKSAE